MDNGLVQIISGAQRNDLLVLILIVVDNGLVPDLRNVVRNQANQS